MNKPILVGECGKEHNGDIHKAKEMIRKAKNSGFDYVKFQAYSLSDINVTHSNYKRYVNCWFNLDQLKDLKEYATDLEIGFFCSVFSKSMIKPLSEFTNIIKIPSTFFKHEEFVKECCDNFPMVQLSTGMASMDDIKDYTIKYRKYTKRYKDMLIYHCTSLYPTPPNETKLDRLREYDYIYRGYSDHSEGVRTMLLSWLMGAEWIEKHFTINSNKSKWCIDEVDMVRFNGLVDSFNEQLVDNNKDLVTVEENYKFFKKEFKDLEVL